MEWTTDKPTRDGYYWWHRHAFKDRILLIEDLHTKLGDEYIFVGELDGQWSSEPIPEPKESI